MTCSACEEAKVNRWSGAYHADCLECAARALSHGPTHYTARKSQTMTPAYRDALQSIFGNDWQEGHLRVKWWAKQRESNED